ncbi:YeeE/YedE thiosulfate transporter family protein [Limibacter armeniacum]|uniref:YeeE/YedE family protein n=1 Tax=Limibacter armeniacum TaxID=466084 RepID=UPI002FE6A9CC
MDWIQNAWPWYVSGPMIALVMTLLLITGKSFGMSANLRVICAACGAGKKCDFFSFDWKVQRWNLMFAFGAILGGVLAVNFMNGAEGAEISAQTVADLKALGVASSGESLLPKEFFNLEFLLTWKGLVMLIGGGFMVGFGARYAGGCTSGHAISGLSNLQLPSLIAVIGFFIGGLIMTHLLMPLILG